eukprot:708219-Rhodomonas_salina.1
MSALPPLQEDNEISRTTSPNFALMDRDASDNISCTDDSGQSKTTSKRASTTSIKQLLQLARSRSDNKLEKGETKCKEWTPLFARMPSRNEEESTEKKDRRKWSRSPRYVLEVAEKRSVAGATMGLVEVSHRFRWVPKSTCRRFLPFQGCTVGEYWYTQDEQMHLHGRHTVLKMEEFEPFYSLAQKFGPKSEGVSWEEAVGLTRQAEEQADVITYQLDGVRPMDSHVHHGVIRTPGQVKATYPRSWFH